MDKLKDVDPLLVKAWLTPDALTPAERKQTFLKLYSFFADFLPAEEVREALDNAERDASPEFPEAREFNEAAREMIEGKLALREIGLTKQRTLTMGLMAPDGTIWTEESLRAARAAQRRAKRKKTKQPKGKSPKGKSGAKGKKSGPKKRRKGDSK